MAYSGSPINHSSQYNFSVSMGAGGGAWTCTLIWMKSSGSTASEIITATGNRTVPTGAARMVFIITSAATTSGTLTVTQGGMTLHTYNFTEEVIATFDVT